VAGAQIPFCQGAINLHRGISRDRKPHYPPLEERLAGEPQAPENPDPVSALRHRLKTAEGKTHYAKRKSTAEPVFGIIKHVTGFRPFMLRGLVMLRQLKQTASEAMPDYKQALRLPGCIPASTPRANITWAAA
jgi:Transposase DDE domain